MKPPEEDAPFQEHIDYVVHKYWTKPIIIPLMQHIALLLGWFVNDASPAITSIFEREKVDRK